MRQDLENFMILKNYAPSSIKTYLSIYDLMAKDGIEILSKPKNEVMGYLAKKVKENKTSANYTAQFASVANIIRLNFLGIDDKVKIPRPNKPVMQPDVLSVEEVQKMINVTKNAKHKAIIALMYATGMRSNEVCNLKVDDIDNKTKVIRIKQAKGMKDRVAMLDGGLLTVLRKYFIEYMPNVYLFNGATGGKFAVRSVQQIIVKAAKQCQIKKRISSHSMRHSCFTQLIKDGVDIRYIQKLAGHKNINTTARYLQINDLDVLTIKSPLSKIKID